MLIILILLLVSAPGIVSFRVVVHAVELVVIVINPVRDAVHVLSVDASTATILLHTLHTASSVHP